MYAEAGVPEAWIVDLVDRAVFMYRDPRNGTYTAVHMARAGESIACTAFPADTVPVGEIILASAQRPVITSCDSS